MDNIVLFWAGCWICCMLLAGRKFNPSWTAMSIFALLGPVLLVLEAYSRGRKWMKKR